MSKWKFIFGLILLKGFLLRGTYSQCGGTKQVIHPSKGDIQSPNYPDELGKAANCNWEFSSGGKEYMLVLTVVKLRLYFLVNEKKKCSGSYILKMDKDIVDCEKYVDPPNNAATFCNAYYSSDTCNTKKAGCETNNKTSFPIRVTYESDGKSGKGPVIGFKIKYKYIECLPEASTAIKKTPLIAATSAAKFTNVTTEQEFIKKTTAMVPEAVSTIQQFTEATGNAENPETIFILTIATVIMGVLILSLLITVAVLVRQRLMLLERVNASAPSIFHVKVDTPERNYENEVEDDPGPTYENLSNMAEQVDEEVYEIPVDMRHYQNALQNYS